MYEYVYRYYVGLTYDMIRRQWRIQTSRNGGGVIAGAAATVHAEGTLLSGGMLPLKILKSRAAFPAIWDVFWALIWMIWLNLLVVPLFQDFKPTQRESVGLYWIFSLLILFLLGQTGGGVRRLRPMLDTPLRRYNYMTVNMIRVRMQWFFPNMIYTSQIWLTPNFKMQATRCVPPLFLLSHSCPRALYSLFLLSHSCPRALYSLFLLSLSSWMIYTHWSQTPVSAYKSLVWRLVVGQFELAEDNVLFHPMGSRVRRVWVEVNSAVCKVTSNCIGPNIILVGRRRREGKNEWKTDEYQGFLEACFGGLSPTKKNGYPRKYYPVKFYFYADNDLQQNCTRPPPPKKKGNTSSKAWISYLCNLDYSMAHFLCVFTILTCC